MTIAYFDCFAGISGDMTLGALIDAGVDQALLKERLAALDVGGYRIEIGRKTAGYIEATDVRVILEEAHSSHHPHDRRLAGILETIRAADLSEEVKRTAGGIFRRLADAEGKVHGYAPEEVHFHEVGAVDAIVDIVGTALCLEMLGWPKVVASPMPTFHGYATRRARRLPAPRTGHRRDPPRCSLAEGRYRGGTGHADRRSDHPGDRRGIRSPARDAGRADRLRRWEEQV